MSQNTIFFPLFFVNSFLINNYTIDDIKGCLILFVLHYPICVSSSDYTYNVYVYIYV